jgi:hypothetical protein
VEERENGLRWSDSHVFFFAPGEGARKRCEQRVDPEAGDRIDVLGAVFAHEQKIRRSGHARGKA